VERFQQEDIRSNIAMDMDLIDALDPLIKELESKYERRRARAQIAHKFAAAIY
jgi:hypothetical protein